MSKERDMIDRRKAVVCMEYLARQINNEEIFEAWLVEGVADGDILYGNLDCTEVDEYYTEDGNFKDLMTLFLRIMIAAYNDGGLWCGDVCSYTKGERRND